MRQFSGKTVLITGAAGGIGLETARQMFEAGAIVIMADNNLEALRVCSGSVDPSGERAIAKALDITQSQAVAALCEECAATYGGIDHIVHLAGMYPDALAVGCSDDLWKRLISVNLDGTFYLCRAALPYMRTESSIVLCSSIAAHRGSYAHSAYAASKGAVLSFMRSLALEAAPKTRVNAISPGIIATSMTDALIAEKGDALANTTPLRRFGTAAEVASVAMFLCSSMASFIHGETIHINGGLYMD